MQIKKLKGLSAVFVVKISLELNAADKACLHSLPLN